MKKPVLLLLVPILIFSCTKKDSIQDTTHISGKEPVANMGNPPPAPVNYWGVMVNAADNLYNGDPVTNTGNSEAAWAKNSYGVKFFRMQVHHYGWAGLGGGDATAYRTKFVGAYSTAVSQGLKVILNVNWDKHGVSDGPSTFPNATDYSAFLSDVLNAILTQAGSSTTQKQAYKPGLIVVENEETYRGFFTQSNAQSTLYISELSAAATTCKNFTGFDGTRVEVTNGGISHRILTYIAWRKYYNANTSQPAMQSYLRYAVPRSQFYGWYAGTVATPADVTVTAGTKAAIQSQTDIAYNLVSQYGSIADLSFINVHWYEPCSVGGWADNKDSKNGTAYTQNDPTIYPWTIVMHGTTGPSIFSESMSAITDIAGGKPLVSNETGQHNLEPCLTESLMDAYKNYTAEGQFKYIIWYDGDGDPEYGAKALHDDNNTDGTARWRRPIGDMFAGYLPSNTPSLTCHGNNPSF